MTAEESATKQASESDHVRKLFVEKLDVDAGKWRHPDARFLEPRGVAYCRCRKLEIESFDEDTSRAAHPARTRC